MSARVIDPVMPKRTPRELAFHNGARSRAKYGRNKFAIRGNHAVKCAEAVAQKLTPGPIHRTPGRRRRPPHQPVRTSSRLSL